MKADLLIWLDFLSKYNGQTYFRWPRCANKDLSLFTDASGSWGFSAAFGVDWCAVPYWRDLFFFSNLTLLEMFPLVVAVELWGHGMHRHILVR